MSYIGFFVKIVQKKKKKNTKIIWGKYYVPKWYVRGGTAYVRGGTGGAFGRGGTEGGDVTGGTKDAQDEKEKKKERGH